MHCCICCLLDILKMSDWEDSNDEDTNLAEINEKSWKQIAEQR